MSNVRIKCMKPLTWEVWRHQGKIVWSARFLPDMYMTLADVSSADIHALFILVLDKLNLYE